MMGIRGVDCQYVLPLESIDLTYMSKYVNSSKETIPLWSKKQMDGELEYYEIKITSEEFDEDNCYYESLDTYKCHICNLDVPTIYYKEHNDGLKHKTYKNIFEKVLQRLTQHINLNTENGNTNNTDETYYCVPCSKTVKRKNKYKHEATIYHSKSLKNLQILNDFHNIFTEINNNHESDKNIMETDDSYEETNSYFSEKSFDLFEDPSQTSEFKTSGTRTKETVSFESYIRDVIAKYDMKINLPMVEGEIIHIRNPTGVKIKVSKEHFHSFLQFGSPDEDNTFCVLCDMWIDDAKTHEVEEKHVKNIFKPVNQNFVRAVNTQKSHCLVCNKIIWTQSDHHMISEHHKKTILETKVGQNIQYSQAVMSNRTLCGICNIYIDSHNFLNHIKAKKHMNLKKNIFEDNKIIEVNKHQLLCGVCNIMVDLQSLSVHVRSIEHMAKKNEPKESLKSEYCDVCKVNVPLGGMNIHIKGNPHTTKVAQDATNKKATNSNSSISTSTNSVYSTASDSTNTPSEDKNNAYHKLLKFTNEGGKSKVLCRICDLQVPYSKRNIAEHMEGWYHRQQKQKKLSLFVYDDTKTRAKCKICDINMFYVEKNMMEHILGTLHESEEKELLKFHTIKKQSTIYFCECCEEQTDDYMAHIHSISHTKEYQEEYVIDKSLIRQYVYDFDTSHGLARLYRDLYTNLMLTNKIFKLNESKFYCQYCDIQFGRISEIDHMLGERHRLCMEFEESDN